MKRISVRCGSDGVLRNLLEQHPGVDLQPEVSSELLEFWQDDWHRKLVDHAATEAPFGLIELMDNNPLVCADVVRIPNPAATMALIALGPILRAGIVRESPAIIASFPIDDDAVTEALTTVGWEAGAAVTSGDVDLGSVRGLNAIASIHTPAHLSDLDDIYEEAYGRSFFVRRDEDSAWTPQIAEKRPYAFYRLRVTPGEEVSLLTIQTFADLHGKLGASQIVHTMNVMAGFEETLGVA